MDQHTQQQVGDIVALAHEFFGTAGKFFKEVPQGLDEGARYVLPRRAQLAVAVTNLALSIELYLKAVLLATKGQRKETHDLLALFNALPPEIRESIEREYNERDQMPSDEGTAFDVQFMPAGRVPTDEETAELLVARAAGTDIQSILGNEKNAFRTWRYLYEQAMPGKTTIVRVDYGRLGIIANAIQRHIVVVPFSKCKIRNKP